MTESTVLISLPMALLMGGAFALYLAARLFGARRASLAMLTTAVFGAALILLAPLVGPSTAAVLDASSLPLPKHGTAQTAFLLIEPGGLIIAAIALVLGGCVAFYSGRYMERDPRYATYYPLLLLMVAGMIGMLTAADLFNLYIFLELMSVAAYVLVAFRQRRAEAIEAGFKYLIMGSVGTIVMLLGIALIYRESGTLTFPMAVTDPGPWQRTGIACFVVGLGLKSAIVPLHTWLPDAYGSAPSSISAILAGVISKSTLYMIPKTCLGLGLSPEALGLLLIWVSFLNMTLGNVLALLQTDTKRLLAYSSIAQTGYILFSLGVGLRYGVHEAIQAAIFLLLTHAVMKSLAFLSKGVSNFYLGTSTVTELSGTSAQLPLIAVTFSVALGGLAGIPPLAGFISKWFILGQALRPGTALVYAGLGLFLLNSLVALAYYLPLIARLFSPPDPSGPGTGDRIRISAWMATPLILLAALVIAIGVAPGTWWQWMAHVGPYLLGK